MALLADTVPPVLVHTAPLAPQAPLPHCFPDPPGPPVPLALALVEAKAVRLSCVHPSLIVMLTLCQKLCQVFQFATMNFEGSSIVMTEI